MDNEEVFENIEEVLSNIPTNYNILEEEINVDVQKEFYDASQNILTAVKNENDVLELIQTINTPNIHIEFLKVALLRLSFCDSVKAYRALEAFQGIAETSIKDWGILALQQSRMVLQSSLMGEQQVFISTGLGGKNKKLRYFFIFPYNSKQKIQNSQQQILHKELEYFMKNHAGEVEDIEFYKDYATATTLIPLEAPISSIVRSILDECNQYGNFISEDVLITNMKKFSKEEISELINRNETE